MSAVELLLQDFSNLKYNPESQRWQQPRATSLRKIFFFSTYQSKGRHRSPARLQLTRSGHPVAFALNLHVAFQKLQKTWFGVKLRVRNVRFFLLTLMCHFADNSTCMKRKRQLDEQILAKNAFEKKIPIYLSMDLSRVIRQTHLTQSSHEVSVNNNLFFSTWVTLHLERRLKKIQIEIEIENWAYCLLLSGSGRGKTRWGVCLQVLLALSMARKKTRMNSLIILKRYRPLKWTQRQRAYLDTNWVGGLRRQSPSRSQCRRRSRCRKNHAKRQIVSEATQEVPINISIHTQR